MTGRCWCHKKSQEAEATQQDDTTHEYCQPQQFPEALHALIRRPCGLTTILYVVLVMPKAPAIL